MRTFINRTRSLMPGLSFCAAITTGAYGVAAVENRILMRVWVEPLVVAILLGTVVRTAWTPPARYLPGIAFAAKTLMEVAVALLGLMVSAEAVRAAGTELIVGILFVVLVTIVFSYGIGRALGLSHKLALLIACGNSICGNSAIAAVAPVIKADGNDVAASIAFTAVLGVAVVLLLPTLQHVLHLDAAQYGIFAGLTVYAVPQVVAATAPVAALSVQIGTLVKLVRVMMLGPVVLGLSVSARDGSNRLPAVRHMAPPFILGFLSMLLLRWAGLVPRSIVDGAGTLASLFTIMAMAALGLCVDVRTVRKAGPRVTVVVVLSLFVLSLISLGLIRLVADGGLPD